MTIKTTTTNENRPSVVELIKTRWLNYRRKRFWAIVAILLYTLTGFFAAPLIIKNSVTDLFHEDFGRVAVIEKVEVNPFVLSLRVNGFELKDKDDERLAGIDELFINFQLSSLFNWAWTFSEIQLSGPYFYFERFDTGESRLDQLLADISSRQAAEPASESSEETNPVRLLIQNLAITQGQIDAKDNVPATPVESRLSPINISIQELNTLPDRHGTQSVTIQLPDDGSLTWSGSLTLAPLDSEGELQLEGLRLDLLTAYLRSMLPLESMSANLSSRLHYRVHEDESGDLNIAVTDVNVDVSGVLVTGLTPVSEFVDIPKVSLTGGDFRYPEQSLQFASLVVENPQFELWLKENGELSLLDLIPVSEQSHSDAEADTDVSAWKLGLDEFKLTGGLVSFSDRTLTPAAGLELTNLEGLLTDISNQENAQMPLDLSGSLAQGGNFQLEGMSSVLPGFNLSVRAKTVDIPLSLGQPYIQQFAHINVKAGVLNSEVDISLSDSKAPTLTGSVSFPGLEVNDSLENKRLLGWEMLDIDQFDLNPGELHISSMKFEQSFGRFIINEDQTTNLSKLIVEQSTDSSSSSDPMTVIIGGIRVNEGEMNFADFSLPLPFATLIAHLDGTVSTIATNSDTPANIKLEGQVDEFGLARIDGSMNVLDPIQHTDVTVEFRNLAMSNLSPYTVQFAGREIDEGKLDLGLVYAIDEGQLNGANDVVLSDLILGDKVDHPDASSLPLGLAVGLLKDSDGVIKIDLPVEGDINDPEFKIGGVIWKAVAGMITKIVSAPFRLLGNLIGIDSEELGQFEFLAGRSDLTPPEIEKIAQLEQALNQRPELVVEISGVTDAAIDVPALQNINLRQRAEQLLEKGLGDEDNEVMMLDVEIRSVVESLFIERFQTVNLQELKAKHSGPGADDPEGNPVLDELAYATDMWHQLLESEVVSDEDLTGLANARAEVISAAFLANGQFDPSRVVISEPKEVESEDGEWVTLELSVASD
jgi:uncharacterized protein involved in outer membrane biogenesis